MNILGIVLLAIVFQTGTPGGGNNSATLTGKWISTVTPGPREAPMIAPTLTIEERDTRLFIVFEGERERYPATVFVASKTESLLVAKTPAARGGTRMIIVRPNGDARVSLELFYEYPDSRRLENFYYSEVFRKAR